jgi:putative ABC transport system substrate-binding protein
MNRRTWVRWLDSFSDNRKSKTCTEPRRSIQNRKWAGLSVIVFVLVVTGAVAQAQQPTKVPRIGYLAVSSRSANPAGIEAFRQGLRELGYVEGKSIVIEYRYAEGKLDRLPALAAELVRLKVDIIITGGPPSTRAAKEATVTIPIVMGFDNDPVGNGFVASLARPGGNITGLATLAPELSGKRLELLKEIVPKLSRVTVFGTSTNPGNAQSLRETELAAGKGRADGVLVQQSRIINSQRTQVADLAVKSRRPAIFPQSEYVEAGGLMYYGANTADLFRRAATYVDKILKGAKPADLPVEQPIKFEFIINLKAAKQIGLTIPPNVLARADRVIK